MALYISVAILISSAPLIDGKLLISKGDLAMLESLIHLNDEVTITIPQENRAWGYNPVHDGARARVIGFSEIAYGRINNFGHQPGIYHNKMWIRLMLENGIEHTESISHLNLADGSELSRRQRETPHQPNGELRQKEFVRELPETPFWEGDIVRARATTPVLVITHDFPQGNPELFVVIRITYDRLGTHTDAGYKWPAYDLSDKLMAGWHTSANEDDLELVERGNIWKFYHNEPLTFTNLQEEAEFFTLLGHTEEVRNPKNNLYSWTRTEVLEAIYSGLVHAFALSNDPFNFTTSVTAIKFHDEDLGRRVAAATLQAYNYRS